MSLRRLRIGETIAAVSAILLFVFMFFDWYGYKETGNLLVGVRLFGYPKNAWESLGVIAWFLLLAIVAALGAVVLRISGSNWKPGIPIGSFVAAQGGLATVLVGLRIVVPPSLGFTDPSNIFGMQTTVELGAFLSLAAAVGIALGGCLAVWEERLHVSSTYGPLGPLTYPSPKVGLPRR